MALEYGIGCHSDCCLGSYINPFTEEAGFKLPSIFDFRIEGVTSISCDPHKFCYGPKGLSTIMFRSKELRRLTWFAASAWPGGMYMTPSIAGSRPGSVIAGTWAALMKQGREGFVQKAKDLLTAAQKIRVEIDKIPEIDVISWDHTTVVSFTSKKVNPIALNDVMLKNYKWSLNALQLPPASHLVVTDANASSWKDFAVSLEGAVKYMLEHPELSKKGDAAIYGMADVIPNRAIVDNFLSYYMESLIDTL